MGPLATVADLARRLKAHNVVVTSAGVAFYGLLALVPTLIALISIYGLITDPAEIEQQVTDAAGSLDETTRAFVTDLLTDIVGETEQDGSGGGSAVGRWIGLIGGIALALFSASGAVQKLMGTIGTAYEAIEERAGWKVRALAYLFTLGAIIGVVLMALVIAAAPALLDRADLGGAAENAIRILQFPALGLLFGGALTVLYRYGPDRSPRTPWRNPGAVAATVLFILFAVGFSIYSSNVGLLPASYGLLGSIAVLMIFLQLTAVSVIVGAEVNAVVEARAAEGAQATTAATLGLAAGTAGPGRQPRGDGATLGFGKALAGLVALFALARAATRGD